MKRDNNAAEEIGLLQLRSWNCGLKAPRLTGAPDRARSSQLGENNSRLLHLKIKVPLEKAKSKNCLGSLTMTLGQC